MRKENRRRAEKRREVEKESYQLTLCWCALTRSGMIDLSEEVVTVNKPTAAHNVVPFGLMHAMVPRRNNMNDEDRENRKLFE